MKCNCASSTFGTNMHQIGNLSLTYAVIWMGILEACVFIVKRDHSLIASGKTAHCFYSCWETIPDCTVNIEGAIQPNVISLRTTGQVCILRINALGYWNITAFPAPAPVYGWVGVVLSGLPHRAFKLCTCELACLAYESFCDDCTNPCTLLHVFVRLEQLDETPDAPLPNVTSSPSFWENKLALS